MLIRSHPTTWMPSARIRSQQCAGQVGTSSISPSGNAHQQGDHRGREGRVEERAGRTADVGVGSALDEDEPAVRDAGGEPEDHAEERVLTVGAGRR